MRDHVLSILWTVCFALTTAGTSAGTDVYFRSDRGVAADDRQPLPERFDVDDVLLWKQSLAPGHSTPCLTGDLIVLTVFENQQLLTLALDRHTGRERWRRVTPTRRMEATHPAGSPATPTAASDRRNVYVFFGSYGLLCYDLQGNLVWAKPMGPFQDEYGANSSPVLANGKVILNQDHDAGSFVIAIDKTTGETVWQADRPDHTRSYSTPVIQESNGRLQIIVAGALQLSAYDVETGEKLWWVNGLARIVNPTPALGRNLLYVASWSPGGDTSARISMETWPLAVQRWDQNNSGKIEATELAPGPVLGRFVRIDLDQDGGLDQAEWEKHAHLFQVARNSIIAVRPGGQGDVTETHVLWKYFRGVPYVTSPSLYRDAVYMVKKGGIVTTLDPDSGKLFKQGRVNGGGGYYASPVAGDGKVYLASEKGVVTVLRAGPHWEVVSSHDFGERILATPVINDGSVYLRTEETLYCFRRR